MKKKILICVFVVAVFYTLFVPFVYCTNIKNVDKESIVDNVKEELKLTDLLDTLTEYTNGELDLGDIASSLIYGNGTDYGIIGNFVLDKCLNEIHIGLKAGISILIIIILMSIMKSIELEKDSSISKIANMVGFLVVVILNIKTYTNILTIFLNSIDTLTSIIQVVAPFMLAVLIATGEIVTSGIVGPIIMFVTGAIGLVIKYAIIPLLTIAIVFKIISNISDTTNLSGLGKLSSTTAMWIIAVVFALFLGIVGLESSITTSVDSVTVKTTQAAVSNLVPVLGKFVSDSIEVVMGASQVIGKTAGVIGVITIVIIAIIPIIKLLVMLGIYSLLQALAEGLMADEKITKVVEAFKEQYKTLLGIMVGTTAIFIIAIGVVIALMGKVAS